jgi:hypothetical protein
MAGSPTREAVGNGKKLFGPCPPRRAGAGMISWSQSMGKTLANRLDPIAFVKRIFAAWMATPPAALQPYRQPRNPLRHGVKKFTIISLIAFVGMFYGLMVAIFPMAFYLYMSMPILIVLLLVIWALPETDIIPRNTMHALFFGFFLNLLIWPNYLAVDPPGLPWITFRRLTSAPLLILFLVSLSISRTFREEFKALNRQVPWIFRLNVAFIFIQLITLPLSGEPFYSLNQLFNALIEFNFIFYVAAWVFTRDDAWRTWSIMFLGMIIFLCLIGVWEKRINQVPWAGHIPSFLAIQDEFVARVLAGGSRAGEYRAQATFSTPLNFAEILGLSTAFILYWIEHTKRLWIRVALVLSLPALFVVIRWTDSRLGVVGFIVSIAGYTGLWAYKRWRDHKHDLISPALLLAYPVGMVAFFILSLIWTRLRVMTWGGGIHNASNAGREAQLDAALPMIAKWPFGHGIGRAGEVLGYQNQAGQGSIDNYFLVIALDFGVLGFFIYFGLMFVGIFTAILNGLDAKNDEERMLLPIGVLLIAFVTIKWVLAQASSHSLIFMALGMVAGLVYRKRAREGRLVLPPEERGV